MSDGPKKDEGFARNMQASGKAYINISRAGYSFSSAILVCGGLGLLIDRYWNLQPWGVITMLFVGFVAGLMGVWRALGGSGKAAGRSK
ncbi:MAG: AtpZ/AtpI family protein [Alphaproteobacteria bacterium]|nr:AtpZ/AtpI family protein [Alphaproteobacteria bacterium]